MGVAEFFRRTFANLLPCRRNGILAISSLALLRSKNFSVETYWESTYQGREPMDGMNDSHPPHGGRDRDGVPQGHRPYWKNAHRDWRFWIAVFFIFGAIVIYVMSDDLALVPRGQQHHQQSSAEKHVGK
jgi:hypothetical protein